LKDSLLFLRLLQTNADSLGEPTKEPINLFIRLEMIASGFYSLGNSRRAGRFQPTSFSKKFVRFRQKPSINSECRANAEPKKGSWFWTKRGAAQKIRPARKSL
jgi:hypothetical protein